MPDAENNKNDGGGLNRRNFLKNAGVAVAGGTLSAGLTLTPESRRSGRDSPDNTHQFPVPHLRQGFQHLWRL